MRLHEESCGMLLIISWVMRSFGPRQVTQRSPQMPYDTHHQATLPSKWLTDPPNAQVLHWRRESTLPGKPHSPNHAILAGKSLPRPSRPSQNYSPSCENGSIAPVKGALVPHSLGEGKRVNNHSYEFQ